ncbi:hypothetical protein QQ045_004266 [Rhodiola kirilowii]
MAGHDGKPIKKINQMIIKMMKSVYGMEAPMTESPVNVEAAKEWRDHRDQFRKKVTSCVRKSQEMV